MCVCALVSVRRRGGDYHTAETVEWGRPLMLVTRSPTLPSFGELLHLDDGVCSAEVVCLLTDLIPYNRF